MKKYDASEERIASVVSKMQEAELSWIPEDEVLEREYPVSESFRQRMELWINKMSEHRRRRKIGKTLATAASVLIVLLAALNYPSVARATQFIVRWIEQKNPESGMVEELETEQETETETTSQYPMRGSTEQHFTYRVETGANGETYVYKSKNGKEVPCCEEYIYGFNPETGACDVQGAAYYVGPEGYLYKNGWFLTKYGGQYLWKYFDESGQIARKWREIDGEWYYFNYNGIPLRDETLEENGVIYYFDEDGKWIQEETIENTTPEGIVPEEGASPEEESPGNETTSGNEGASG
ncbi:MAG: hypothetical protein MR355_04190 [Lachnospiraceae bacterium]|nr:hypothetical protein [Lachnospiraceae bacterium]